MVMSREDSSWCRIVTCKETTAVSPYRPMAEMKSYTIKSNIYNNNHECLFRAFSSCVTTSQLLTLSDISSSAKYLLHRLFRWLDTLTNGTYLHYDSGDNYSFLFSWLLLWNRHLACQGIYVSYLSHLNMAIVIWNKYSYYLYFIA